MLEHQLSMGDKFNASSLSAGATSFSNFVLVTEDLAPPLVNAIQETAAMFERFLDDLS
jgi:hypothetical protein